METTPVDKNINKRKFVRNDHRDEDNQQTQRRKLVSSKFHKNKMALNNNDNDTAGSRKVRRFKILLPNGMSVDLEVQETIQEMRFGEFILLVQEKYFEACRNCESLKKKREINWKSRALHIQDCIDADIWDVIKLTDYKPYKCHILRLQDGSDVAQMFENMWDLTPDKDLLRELPEEFNFEAALADLIDNSLQAVWANKRNNRKLIRVNVSNEKILICDNGPGMDDSDENSLVKWGKIGASLHKLSKTHAIGGKPPYLMPYFGMFGYGGPIASMHLGRRTRVSSKTEHVKKVYMLFLVREALLSSSNSSTTWKTNGGMRDPSKHENRVGSFTKVEIYDVKVKDVDVEKLQWHIKDTYFPYIQNDDFSDNGKTTTPIEFQVNGVDLREVQGGKVAITNLHSCNGPEFVLQLHLSSVQDHDGSKKIQEANARLRFVYYPFTEGKENIERILEKLRADGYPTKENFQNFSRVSVRRLGRLLPDASWTLLPFMDFRHKRGNKADVLKRCSLRVKCFIETDAGFKPTKVKGDLDHHNNFTIALKNLGSKIADNDNDVKVEICKATKMLTPLQLEKEYQEWIFQMHNLYDEEADSGEDNPIIIVNPENKKELGISSDVVRVHRALKRKEKSWQRDQKIKVLKGACAGYHKSNVYATIEYFLLEGFEGEAVGEARIICRPIGILEANGSFLSASDENPTLEIHGSLSLPIHVIDTDKVLLIGRNEWEKQLRKRTRNATTPSSLGPNHHKEPTVDEELGVLCQIGEKIYKLESNLKYCGEQRDKTEQEILKLREKLQHYGFGNVDSYLSKEEIMTKLISMENTAASVLLHLSTQEKQQNHLIRDIIGYVALLGSVQSLELSRIFAQYLGEDKMLGIVLRDFESASSLEMYQQNGEIDCMSALHAEAGSKRKAITKRFLVMCFENIRPYTGFRQCDPQRKLVLPFPKLPNGRIPAGFMGYAVNMIELDKDHEEMKTASGYGLRETVLFSLFKKLQVYRTRENLIAACECLEDGGVSLDGGIIREDGSLFLGYGRPSVYFPCMVDMMNLSPEAKEIWKQVQEMKTHLSNIDERIRNDTTRLNKYLKKFEKKKKRCEKNMDEIVEPMPKVS